MLRFIRKYQLFILVIGGSLLMVVFLLQPVLNQLSPSTLKSKIASLEDGTSISRGEQMQAALAINLLKRVHPRSLGTRQTGGMGLDPTNESNRELHWLLLVKQADKAGLIGEAGDGASWLSSLAAAEAQIQVRLEVQQGLIQSEEQFTQRTIDLGIQIGGIMERNARLSAGNVGGTMEDVFKILAQARGVYRMLSSIQTMPAYSDLNALYAAHDMFDSVAVNAAILDSSLAASAVPEPTEEQLQAFFDVYKAQNPADNEYNIGYTQPTRIQLGWLTLDKNVFMNAVKADRVELNKIWLKNRDKYPGDFALERFNLERQYRDEQATDMMVEADRIIRALVLAVTNGLPKSNGILTLPADWETIRPELETIAETLVTRVNAQFSVSLPTPAITMIGDRWLNANAISALPGYGSSSYRIGSRELPTYTLTQFFELDEANTTGLDVQVGLPLADPAASDSIGNRYYAVVLDVREQGPADTISDVTREQVLADYMGVEGFKVLSARINDLKAAIAIDSSLAPAIDLAAALASDQESVIRPTPVNNILVQRDTIDRGRSGGFVDPKLNIESFRTAVRDSAAGLDPLATPEVVAANPIPVVVKLPAARSIAVSVIVAPRPLTSEDFLKKITTVISRTRQAELIEAALDLEDPFSYDSMVTRFGLVRLKKDDYSDVSKSDTDSESESEEG